MSNPRYNARPSKNHLILHFDDRTIAKGEDYKRRKKVLHWFFNSNEHLEATVSGTGGNVYRTHLHLKNHNTEVKLSRCSCPVGADCKHAVALLLTYVTITGATRDRTTPVKEFQEGDAEVFLISLKAGGTGLNLTAADVVIHYDPWWNPAAEEQATDRAHRIGQTKTVFVYKLIAQGTIEQKMLDMQARKRQLASSIYDEQGNVSLSFSESDLEALLAPLE